MIDGVALDMFVFRPSRDFADVGIGSGKSVSLFLIGNVRFIFVIQIEIGFPFGVIANYTPDGLPYFRGFCGHIKIRNIVLPGFLLLGFDFASNFLAFVDPEFSINLIVSEIFPEMVALFDESLKGRSDPGFIFAVTFLGLHKFVGDIDDSLFEVFPLFLNTSNVMCDEMIVDVGFKT